MTYIELSQQEMKNIVSEYFYSSRESNIRKDQDILTVIENMIQGLHVNTPKFIVELETVRKAQSLVCAPWRDKLEKIIIDQIGETFKLGDKVYMANEDKITLTGTITTVSNVAIMAQDEVYVYIDSAIEDSIFRPNTVYKMKTKWLRKNISKYKIV